MDFDITYHPAGDTAEGLNVGDFILTRGSSFYSKAIRFGQIIEHGSVASRVNHAALSLGGKMLNEALSDGVIRTSIVNYHDTPYSAVRFNFSESDRHQIEVFAHNVVNEKCYGYGWLQIASIIMTIVTPSTVFFGTSETEICSGFVAAALTRAGLIWPKQPSFMMPSDLATEFKVELPV